MYVASPLSTRLKMRIKFACSEKPKVQVVARERGTMRPVKLNLTPAGEDSAALRLRRANAGGSPSPKLQHCKAVLESSPKRVHEEQKDPLGGLRPRIITSMQDFDRVVPKFDDDVAESSNNDLGNFWPDDVLVDLP